MSKEKERCPMCNHVLYKRYEGLVCKNWQCKLYHKYKKGWIKVGGSDKEQRLKWDLSWLKEIGYGERLNKWLELKKKVLKRDDYTCQRCQYTLKNYDNDIRVLVVHHINRRSEYPELTFDQDNCITLCEKCDNDVHEKDKFFFHRLE